MKRVVVVDDEPITRLDICQTLQELNFCVVAQAADGYDAVEECRTHRPDIVLMDVRMPVFDGLHAAQSILEQDLACCVVLLTAFSDRELVESAGKIGVTGYLVKPLDSRLILPTLEVAFAQGQALRKLRSEKQSAEEQVQNTKLIERAKAVLAKQKGIDTSKAYSEMRRLAMDKRCSIEKIAAAIVEQAQSTDAVKQCKLRLMSQRGISEQEAFDAIDALAKKTSTDRLQAAKTLLAQGGGGQAE